jgi:hypothetical protein
MSHEIDKEQHSKRIYQKEVKINKQVKIAKAHGLTDKDKAIKEPHRLAKHHAMNCGIPNCVMCGNPRRTFGDKTMQERRFDQTETWVD